MYIDLYNFKYVNDKYGRQIGDSLLVSFATHVRQLCKILRPAITPTVLRLVYLVMSLLFCSSPRNGLMIVRRSLLNACWHRSKIKPTHHLAIFPLLPALVLRPSLKMANTLRNCCSMPIPPCIKRKCGQNQVAYYSQALDQIVQRRNNIERALRLGLFYQEFNLAYQPYFTCSGKRLVGFEVLLRWQSELLGEVSPEEFIPIAEQTGLFGTIDRWVISKAFQEISTLQAMVK